MGSRRGRSRANPWGSFLLDPQRPGVPPPNASQAAANGTEGLARSSAGISDPHGRTGLWRGTGGDGDAGARRGLGRGAGAAQRQVALMRGARGEGYWKQDSNSLLSRGVEMALLPLSMI